jgi:hypothetical protein
MHPICKPSDKVAFCSGVICAVLSIPTYVFLQAEQQWPASIFHTISFVIFVNATYGLYDFKEDILMLKIFSRDENSEARVGGWIRRFWLFAGGLFPTWLVLVILAASIGVLE